MAVFTLKPSVVALAVCTALASSYAMADESYTWEPGESGSEDWFTGTNWNPNGTPNSGDIVLIKTRAEDISNPIIAAGMVVDVGTVFIDRSTSLNPATLTVNGKLTVTAGLVVGGDADAELSISTIADAAEVTASNNGITIGGFGKINIGAAAAQAATLPGKLKVPSIEFFGTESRLNLNHADNSGAYTLDASLSGLGQINVMAGTTTLTAYSPDFAGQTTLRDGGTLILNQPLAGTIQIDNGAVLGLNPIDSSDYLLTANLAGAGQIDIIAGSVSLIGDNSGFTGKTTLSNNSTLIVDQLVGGAMQIDSGSTLRGGNTLSGVLTNSGSGTWVADGDVKVSDTGVINIGAAEGADPALPGQIETGLIQFVGAGGGQLNFNHIDDSGSYILSADLSGPGKIKAIAGTTKLTGNMSTFTGQTELSGTGALILNRPLGGSIHIGDGTTLSLNNVNPITYQLSASLSGTGQINIMAGTVELTADNSGFTGQTTLGGNSKLEIDQPLGGTIQINSGTTLTSGSSLLSAVVNNSGTWNATAGIDVSDTGVINIGAAEGEAPARDGQLTTPRIAFAGAEGKLNFNHVNNTSSGYTLDAQLSGPGRINVAYGTTSLTGDISAFTGKTTLSGGTLIVEQFPGQTVQIGNGATLRGASNVTGVLTNSGVWEVSSINVNDAAVINIGGAETAAIPGQIDTPTINFAGTAGKLNFNHTDTSGDYTLAANLSGPGQINAIAGTTKLTGNNSTFSGQTTLSGSSVLILNRPLGGSIQIGSDAALSLNHIDSSDYVLTASLAGTGQINVTANKVELTADNSGFTGRTTLSGNSELVIGQPLGGTIQINSGTKLTSGSSLSAVVNNSGTWNAASGIDVSDTAVINIGAAETAAVPGQIDTPTINFAGTAGKLNFNHTDTSGDYTLAANLSGPGQINAIAGTTKLTGNNSTFSGQTTLSGSSVLILNRPLGGSIQVDSDATLGLDNIDGMTLPASLAGTGQINVTANKVELIADNSGFTGRTTLSGNSELVIGQPLGGTIQINSGTKLTSGSSLSAVVNNSGTWNAASGIDVSDTAVINIGGAETAAIPGQIDTPTINFAGTAGKLNFNHTDTSGNYTLAANLSGSGQINAIAGTTTLSGNNADFSGQTTVSSGSSLRVSQSLGGQVIINEGAELGLAGTLSGSVDNAGSLVAVNALSGHSADPVSQLNVNALTNRGTIVLAGSTVGNTLTVTGGLVSDNGHLYINTIFNGDNSQTDKLILDGGTASGTTYLTVNAQGGNDGNAHRVRVVETRNSATTAEDAFTLNQAAPNHRRGHNRVVLGAYDYQLVRGGGSGGPDDWYLVVAGGGGGGNVPAVRPEAGSYLSNQALTQALLGSTWHERSAAQQDKSGWVKVAAGHTRNQSAHGTLETKANNTRVQIGTDVVRQDNADKSSVVMGVMGGYAKADGKTTSHSYTYTARNRVTGYNVGVYGSWYQTQDGWYVDGSLQYGQYRNEVEGDGLAKEKYDSQAWAASLETGYAVPFGQAVRGQQWFVQPHVQVAYTHYNADDHHEATGSKVSVGDKNNVLTRVGARLYARELANQGRAVQPFIEANWLHNNHHASVAIDGDVVKGGIPNNVGELKAGVEGMLTRQWTVWGDVGLQYGKHDYRDVKGLLGAKYRW